MENSFPKHNISMTLTHNEHKNYYKTVKELIDGSSGFYNFENENYKKISIDTDEIWTLQWYPDTSIGFYSVAAPTLADLLRFADKD